MPKVRNIYGQDMAVITAVNNKGIVRHRLFTEEQIKAGHAERWTAQIDPGGVNWQKAQAKKQAGYRKTRLTRRLKTDSTRRRKRSKQ